jgi:hypothetical protein
MANYLEVLISKNDALDAELSLVDNKYQQYKAINCTRPLADGNKVL